MCVCVLFCEWRNTCRAAMAIPYAGVNRLLKDASTPWLQKIQLAKFAWISPKCFLPNREQVLIDWSINSIVNASKFSIPDNVIPALWQFLQDVLQSKQLQSMGSRLERLSIRPSLFPVLISSLEPHHKYEEQAIGCCLHLLDYASLGTVITGQLENQVKFLSAVLNLLISYLKADDGRTCSKLNSLVHKAFESFASLQRQQPNPRKILAIIFAKLLQPSLMLHYTITSLSPTSDALYTDTLTCIQDLIANGLFQRDLVDGHIKYLRLSPGEVNTDKQKEVKLLHEAIIALWKNISGKVWHQQEDDCSCSYIAGMPVLFSAFLSIQQYPKDVSFALFCKLCHIMGIMPLEVKSKPNTETEDIEGGDCQPMEEEKDSREGYRGNWSVCLLPLSELLDVVSEKQIYEVASDNMEGKVQFAWLVHLVNELMSNADSSSISWFNCLHKLLDMNHLLLEDKLPQILKEALYCSAKESPEKNAQLLELRDSFLEKLLGVYTKLRQFDKVVAALLEASMISTTSQRLGYPQHFADSFSESVQLLPPGLTLTIWKQFHQAFSQTYLPQLNQTSSTISSPSPSKKRKKVKEIAKEVNIEPLSRTFHLYLRSMRLVDASLTAPLLKRVEVVMNEMKGDILELLLDRSRKSKLSESQVHCTLLLCHVWGELYLMLSQHTNYGNPSADRTEKCALWNITDSLWLDSLPDWSSLSELFCDKEDILQLQISLVIQQIRALILHSEVDSVQQSLTNMTIEVCNKVTDMEPSSSRNLLPILLEHLPILLPYLPSQHLAKLISLLCEILMSRCSLSDKQLLEEGPGEDAVLYRVCEQFVSSEFCMESRRLQTALVNCVLNKLSEVTSSFSPQEVAFIQRLSKVESSDSCKDDDVSRHLEDVAMDFNRLLTDRSVAKKKVRPVGLNTMTSLYGTLKIFQFLPLHHLLPSNVARCMLGLLFVDLTIGYKPPKKSQDVLEFGKTLLLCRQVEAAILKGIGKVEFLHSIDALIIATEITNVFLQADNQIFQKSTTQTEQSSGDLNDVTEELLTYWLKRVMHMTNQEAAASDYCIMMESRLSELVKHLTKSKHPNDLLTQNIPLLTTCTTLLNAILAGNRGSLISQTSESVEDRIPGIINALSAVMKYVECSRKSPRLFHHMTKVATGLVKFALRFTKISFETSAESSKDDSDAMETNVSVVTVTAKQWRNLINLMLSEISYYFTSADDKSCPVIGCCLSFMQTSSIFIGRHCSVSTSGMDTSSMWLALISLMGTRVEWTEEMRNEFQTTFERIVGTMDMVQLQMSLSDLLKDTAPSKDDDASHKNLLGALFAWQLLPSSVESEESQGALAEVTPKLIHNLMSVLLDAVQDWTGGGAIALSVLRAVTSIIEHGESLVLPDDTLYAQHFCVLIPVTMVTDAEFPLVFNTLCQILRHLLIGYPRTVMASLASYFACLQSLLKNVMQRGQQRPGTSDRLSDHDLYMCAENMERLLTMIATYKEDVNKLAVFLVADYIAELQKGTLLPLFKKTLVTGVYNLLDVADERAIDFLNANMPLNLREIFKTFYNDFQKYYRYSGKV
ncbi:unhealthy ribosome biogenesis protein 2 homolog [Asterias rubens]|uniref:unhealthy ribosome biogenesis protein 2 homolog n=1 Tax=Asterias rubens TaxID=7604 RepID=UPI001455D784|nr:unhealthy ribosome biogenesis protein 2 homolog [Asterias rubens]